MKSKFIAAVLAVVLTGGMLTACQPDAMPGHRCGPDGDYGVGAGWDKANTYRCVDGYWQWAMTTRDAALAIKAAQDAQAAGSSPSGQGTDGGTEAPAAESVLGCHRITDMGSDVWDGIYGGDQPHYFEYSTPDCSGSPTRTWVTYHDLAEARAQCPSDAPSNTQGWLNINVVFRIPVGLDYSAKMGICAIWDLSMRQIWPVLPS